MSISVVIPTCDRSTFLREALESVASQTYSAYEVIIVDNGDFSISSQLLIDYPKIKVIRTDARIGGSRARNIGFRHASGDYVAFLDDDDLFDTHYLAHIAREIERNSHRVDLLIGVLKIWGNAATIRGHSLPQDRRQAMRQLLVSNPGVTGSNVVLRAKFFGGGAPFDESLPGSQDRAFVLDALLAESIYVVVKDAAVMHRRHGGARITDGFKAFATRRLFVQKYWSQMSRRERTSSLLLLLRSLVRTASAHARISGRSRIR